MFIKKKDYQKLLETMRDIQNKKELEATEKKEKELAEQTKKLYCSHCVNGLKVAGKKCEYGPLGHEYVNVDLYICRPESTCSRFKLWGE